MQTAAPSRSSAGFTLVELLVVVVMLSFVALLASSLVERDVVGMSSRAAEQIALAGSSQAARMVKLAGVPLLLFGLGFWYAVELRQPGRLDRFRFAQFLLLALTYSLFFAVFAVLGRQPVAAWLAVTIAAAVSYPLLAMHVATIVDRRFALTAALPLAVVTHAILVNGVYGAGAQRSYVYLGMLCAVVGYLTLSYPRLASGRQRLREQREQRLGEAVAGLASDAAEVRGMIATTRGVLAVQDPAAAKSLRDWVERGLEAAQRAIDSYEAMRGHRDGMRSATGPAERRRACEVGIELAARLEVRLPQVRAALAEAVATLQQHRDRDLRLVDAAATTAHCIACGHPAAGGGQYCAQCGTPSAERRQCPRCANVWHLPRHLLAVRGGDETAIATHCHGCGERHAG